MLGTYAFNQLISEKPDQKGWAALVADDKADGRRLRAHGGSISIPWSEQEPSSRARMSKAT
jgi:hypothetical protein